VSEAEPGGAPAEPGSEQTASPTLPVHHSRHIRVRKKRRTYEFDFQGESLSWMVYAAALLVALLVAWLLLLEMDRPARSPEGRLHYRGEPAAAVRAARSPAGSTSVA
jgi:hypothetical protein